MIDYEDALLFGKNKKLLLKEHERCELCGSRRGLEVHHIIPQVCGGKSEFSNLIVLCCSCHAKLTPKSYLTKVGIDKVRERNRIIDCFNEMLNNRITDCFNEMLKAIEAQEPVTASETVDIIAEVYQSFVQKRKPSQKEHKND